MDPDRQRLGIPPVLASHTPMLSRVGALALLGTVGLAAFFGPSWVTSAPAELRISILATSAAYFIAGQVARHRRPRSRIGPVLVATGLAFMMSVFQGSDLPYLVALGLGGQLIGIYLQVFLMLTFPYAKPGTRAQAGGIVMILGLLVIANAIFIATLDPTQAGLCDCNNPFFLPAAAAIAGTLRSVATAALVVAFAGIVVSLFGRWLGSSQVARRTLTPVLVAGGLSSSLAVVATLIGPGLSAGAALALNVAQTVAYAAVPFGFLLGLLRLRMARGAVADLVVELGETPTPERLREALASALDDPTLDVVYWSASFRTYLDANGEPIDLATDATGRAVTSLERDGEPLAAILHDPALSEDPGLVPAVAAAVRLAVDNERLTAEVRSQLDEVRASRSRIVEASDAERRRVERNLHDGAQQRLVALSFALRRAQVQLPADAGHELTSTLDAASDQLKAALAELRELARGIHPAILTEAGLEPALRALAKESPVPVTVRLDLPDELPAPVAAAAYFVASEALANVAKYADASTVELAAETDGDHLRVEATDDGRGGADLAAGSGLRGLADRAAALGGRLDVWSPVGGGTRVVATLPLGGRTDVGT